jgi:molybdopterin-guanine dinucleotide biosynthesis protein A
MGEDKAGLTWEGKTFLERIAGELGNFRARFVSLGAEVDSFKGPVPEGLIPEGRVRQTQEGQMPEEQVPEGWTVIRDRYADAGPMAGIGAVLEASPFPWVFVVSCDMPRINSAVAEYLWEHASEGTDLVVPAAEDGRRHMTCALWNRSTLPVIRRRLREGDSRLYTLCGEMQTVSVPVNEKIAQAVENINTPMAYLRLKGTGE